jgi:hypothetical protein
LTDEEKTQIIDGLTTILADIEANKFEWSIDLEDVHMNIVYFVLCLVYPMLSVSLRCLFLIVPSVYSSVYCVLCLVYPMLSGDNQE